MASLRFVCGFIFVALATLTPFQSADADADKEYEVKAGFVLNFLKFTNFDHVNGDLRLCVIGQEHLLSIFKSLEKHTISSHPLRVAMYTPYDSAVTGCHVLFIGEGADQHQKQVLEKLSTLQVLTIGEDEAFIGNGGMIRFFAEQSRLRFAVSTDNIDRANLKLSSKLLRLAKIEND